MAAGLGLRYGGNKQVTGTGPNGEILMEYSIYDAIRAGFERIVLIIKPDMQKLMDGICGYLNKLTTKFGAPMEGVYAFQDFSSIPEFYTIPEGRTKPFGTVATPEQVDVVETSTCKLYSALYLMHNEYGITVIMHEADVPKKILEEV